MTSRPSLAFAALAALALAGCPKSASDSPRDARGAEAGDQSRAVAAVADQRALFADCIRLARERMPTIEGRVVLNLAFAASGAVERANITVNETRDMKYPLCVSAVAHQLVVPALASATQVSVGLTLGQDGALTLTKP